jgi:extradiol dioxygenase family protein
MNPIDKRNRFKEEVFSYRTGKDGKVFIDWYGKQVMILKGKQAQNFMSKVEGLESREAQLVMAKITGNFKRGNERQPQKGDTR